MPAQAAATTASKTHGFLRKITGKPKQDIQIILGALVFVVILVTDCAKTFHHTAAVTISAPGVSVVPIARTEEALREIAIAGSGIGQDCFYVKNHTRIRVLNPGFTSAMVRIEEGSYAGESGWVFAEWVK